MDFYSFKMMDKGVRVSVDRPTLAEISHAYVGHCAARPSMNHSSVLLALEGKEVGYIHPDGTIYGKSETSSPVLYSPKNIPEVERCRAAIECLETAIKLYESPNRECNVVVQAIHWTDKAREHLA